jgi:hypothetical protein
MSQTVNRHNCHTEFLIHLTNKYRKHERDTPAVNLLYALTSTEVIVPFFFIERINTKGYL